MILVNNVKTSLGVPEETIVEKALRMLGAKPSEVKEAWLSKTSLDARDRRNMLTVSTVAVRLHGNEEKKAASVKDAVYKEEQPFTVKKGREKLPGPVVIAGFGPAGMFAADLLSREGYRPVVLERGYSVEERVKAVEKFWTEGIFDPACNVQFGAGGAGTFSDGKLTTRINDPLCGYILERFGDFGAPKETLRKAKPHIGTDLLRQVVASIDREVRKNGGDIRYNTRLSGMKIENGVLKGVSTDQGDLPAGQLILAVGHSARDTFRMLLDSGAAMEPKPFSVGARIEHRQTLIDRGLYGDMAGHPALPPGEYQLSHRVDGRAVYTFCMCPGGLVVPSSSEEGQVVTNGMSEYRRDRDNANAAVAVSVDSRDFGSHVLDGVAFQEELEHRAFEMGGRNYRAPAVTVGNFLDGRTGLDLKSVTPSYALGVEPGDFDRLFPKQVTGMLRTGLRLFDRKIKGYASSDAVLTGVETRTSSPVRVLRGEDYEAFGIRGLYPCGEGAGYAGGIMSAAVDGVRIALRIMEQYAPEE